MEKILEVKGVSKSFPGVKALDHVDLNIYPGEVMGLLGENGAGKSTLMRVLSGVYIKDEGELFFKGEQYNPKDPKDAMDKGIAIIHQELNLIENMKVYENIFLGRELKSAGRLDTETMIQESRKLLDFLNSSIDPETTVSELSIANKQLIEIAKALSIDSDIIIMDEPTDTLTTSEVEDLFEVIHALKKENKGIIYISHKLEEIFEICDRYSVLRDGQYIGERITADSNEEEIIEMMVGRSLDEFIPYVENEYEEIALEVYGATNEYIKDVSFSLKKGEVLGISGLVGSGRTELAKSLYGVYPLESGTVKLYGQEININSPREAIRNNIVYVSEDRKGEGLIVSSNVKKNITLSNLLNYVSFGYIDVKKEVEDSNKYIKEMNIRTPSYQQIVENLSGGNQQKVAIAKALATHPTILILDEPTRGVDVGAKKEIYDILNEIKKEGKSIIVISSDMLEVLGISDRLLVMRDGRVVGEFDREEVDQQKIMQAIVRGKSDGK